MQTNTGRATRFANAVFIAFPMIWLLVALFRFLLSPIPFGLLKVINFFSIQIVLAGALLLCLKLNRATKINVSLAIVSIVLTVYAVELVLSFHPLPSDQEKYVESMEKAGTKFDRRTIREVVLDLRKQGVDAFPVFYPGQELTMWGARERVNMIPLSGVSNKTTVYCNESGQYTIYQSDERGFSNPNGMWGSRSIDIAVVGDSYAHGACVSPEEGVIALIRQEFPRTLNLAFGADGPLLELATLKEYLPPLKPKVVLWFYFEGNDLDDLAVEETSVLLKRYFEPEYRQGLAEGQSAIDKLLTAYIDRKISEKDERNFGRAVLDFLSVLNVKRYVHGPLTALHALRSKMFAHVADKTGYFDPSLRTLRAILEEANREVNSWGGRLVFVYLPTWDRYNHSRLGMRDFGTFQTYDDVGALVNDLGIPMVDVHKVFTRDTDPGKNYFVFPGSHYNANGYRVVAREVTAYLEKLQLQGK